MASRFVRYNSFNASNNAALPAATYHPFNRLSTRSRTVMPTGVRNHFGRSSGPRVPLDPVIRAEFFQRDGTLSFPSLDRHRATLLIGHKNISAPRQKRTKSSFFLADSTDFLRSNSCAKKNPWVMSSASSGGSPCRRQKRKKSVANRCGKVFSSASCRGRRFALGLSQTPMRRRKRDTPCCPSHQSQL